MSVGGNGEIQKSNDVLHHTGTVAMEQTDDEKL
jgi:hypothetical protein